MKTKKYFNRIFGVCVALCAAFSLLFSLTYYFLLFQNPVRGFEREMSEEVRSKK